MLQLAACAVGIANSTIDDMLIAKPYCDIEGGELQTKDRGRFDRKRRNISKPKWIVLGFLVEVYNIFPL